MNYDCIIVGGGPAGMAAAIYLRRGGKKVLLIERGLFGGQMLNTTEIENYPGYKSIMGGDLALSMSEQVEALETEVEYSEVVSVDLSGEEKIITTTNNEHRAKYVIFALGANPSKLNIQNEKEFSGRGVSYCATCDGAFYKDKTVAVVGGGNTALLDATYLSNIAKKVYIIHRRNEFRATDILVKRAKAISNIELLTPRCIQEINGDSKLREITLDNGSKIEVDGLFIAVGVRPNTELLKDKVELDEKGFVVVNNHKETNIENVYAIGDCTNTNLRQVITACSDGAVAAESILAR